MRIAASLLLRAAVVLLGAALATFTPLSNAPGDPAPAIAVARFDSAAPDEVVAQIRAGAGFNAGFLQAFLAWIGPLLQGDLGNSSVTGRPVRPEMADALALTVPRALAGLVVGIAIAVPLALLAVRRPGGLVDRGAVAMASLGAALPAYWLGQLLILLFSMQLGWLPAMGARTPAHVVLHALTPGLGAAASPRARSRRRTWRRTPRSPS